ncbi:NUDIX domain-containing protein [Candidatus Woesearchaeota archaeon]|nr:NUDIX domain-containing protein [Candidatus Woesearchaeota archaeon]
MNIEERIAQAEQANRVASFLIPVQDENIFLTERVKDPYKGFYCATGGKRVYLPDSARYETPEETAVREFCEEKYSGTVKPEELLRCDLSIIYLGFIFDDEFDFICHTSIGCFDGAPDFILKQDEVRRKRNLEDIKPENINPITQHMLERVRFMDFNYMLPAVYQQRDFLFPQIHHFSSEPPFDVPTVKYCRWRE